MGVKLVSSGGGSVEINPPATASSFTATMPAGTGTVAVNGVSGTLVSGTAVASTSGTSIDFTGIPSWVKRITVLLNGVSFATSSNIIVQLGTSGGVEATGYSSTASSGTTVANLTTGFIVEGVASAATGQTGILTIATIGSNVWVQSGNTGLGNPTAVNVSAGSKTLSGVLDRVRITGNGATFDAGSINILYE